MAKQRIFTIHDEKAKAFLQPFFMPNLDLAKRALQEIFDDPEHSFTKHTQDYSLFELGFFDDNDGNVVPLDTPVCHCLLLTLKEEL